MKKLVSIFIVLCSVAGIGWAYLNNQWLIDSAVLSQYKPPQDVRSLTKDLQLTSEGERFFYIGQPDIANKDTFNEHCQKRHEKSVVLGCYIAPFHIYIYDVTDQRLDGVKQVTAAHEMLHVVYDRLTTAEKKRLNTLLEQALPSVEAQDASLAERLAIYEKTEPGERYNELHSILGTEAVTLPQELESYYRQYFTDRSIVVQFSEKYAGVLADLQSNQDELVRHLNTLANEITSETEALNTSIQELNTEVETFNQRAKTGAFTSQDVFDQERQALIIRRDTLDSERDALNQKIAAYNQKRNELQQLNIQVKELNTKLDSTASTEL